ncbi:MAG: hypothetical protein IBX69_19295 [Anaerolineales bacterium]|nr:hypothetical protein [Anaerolineales bacterium]
MFEPGTIEGILRNLDFYLTQLHGLARFSQQDLDKESFGSSLLGRGGDRSLKYTAQQFDRF